MSRTLLALIVISASGHFVSAQEDSRRRPVRDDAIWPVFDAVQQTRGIQIGVRGLGQMAPDSAARLDLAAAILKSLLEAGEVNAAGAWLQHEPALNLSCSAWARVALAAARKRDAEVWKRAKSEAVRLAAISPQREGRAGWVLLYEGALLASPEEAEQFLAKLPKEDFESQSALKGLKIRRIGDGLDGEINEVDLKRLLEPPPTQASLNLMAHALVLVDLIREGACNSGRVPFSAVAGEAVQCAVESAANPAPVLVAVLAEAGRFQDAVPLDDWFERATKFLAVANLDEEKPSYLLDLARAAERRGDLGRRKEIMAACEVSLARLEAALQPEGYFRLGETHVRQGNLDQAWRVWRDLLDLLETNPNRDLWFQLSGEIALEIEKCPGESVALKADALAEIEVRVGGFN